MNFSKLQPLGWSNYFLQQLVQQSHSQLALEEITAFRITAIHRNRIEAIGEEGICELMCPVQFHPISQHLAVGDWVIADSIHEHLRISLIIQAKNRIERFAKNQTQVIAANLDYLWIITSANDEFNLKRLQRYLALAYEFDVEPVVILTKTDLCSGDVVDDLLDQIRQLNVHLAHAISVNDEDSLSALNTYFQQGNSIALVGSSGVGKSTLINALIGTEQSTQNIRVDDDKGKHTTTHRQLFFLPTPQGQVAIIDTPGMRELQLSNAEQGIEQTFMDIVELSQRCKFSDCSHSNEPGCAIQSALSTHALTHAHLANYLKLLKEDEFLKRRDIGAHAEKQHERAFFKMIHSMRTESW
ncbi:MAG: ribosome small subunit-dependent GTPase A [Oleispira sp.]